MAKTKVEETLLPDGRVQRNYILMIEPGELDFRNDMPPPEVLRALGIIPDDGTQKSEQGEATAGVEADGATAQPAGDDAGAETS